MTTKFTNVEVKKIARLCSLELTEKETEIFAKQFSTIIDYFELLKEVEMPDLNYDYDEHHLSNDREDKVVKSHVSPEKFSPYMKNGFFKVPKVINPDN